MPDEISDKSVASKQHHYIPPHPRHARGISYDELVGEVARLKLEDRSVNPKDIETTMNNTTVNGDLIDLYGATDSDEPKETVYTCSACNGRPALGVTGPVTRKNVLAHIEAIRGTTRRDADFQMEWVKHREMLFANGGVSRGGEIKLSDAQAIEFEAKKEARQKLLETSRKEQAESLEVEKESGVAQLGLPAAARFGRCLMISGAPARESFTDPKVTENKNKKVIRLVQHDEKPVNIASQTKSHDSHLRKDSKIPIPQAESPAAKVDSSDIQNSKDTKIYGADTKKNEERSLPVSGNSVEAELPFPSMITSVSRVQTWLRSKEVVAVQEKKGTAESGSKDNLKDVRCEYPNDGASDPHEQGRGEGGESTSTGASMATIGIAHTPAPMKTLAASRATPATTVRINSNPVPTSIRPHPNGWHGLELWMVDGQEVTVSTRGRAPRSKELPKACPKPDATSEKNREDALHETATGDTELVTAGKLFDRAQDLTGDETIGEGVSKDIRPMVETAGMSDDAVEANKKTKSAINMDTSIDKSSHLGKKVMSERSKIDDTKIVDVVLTPAEEKDWIVLDGHGAKKDEDEWDMCVDGENLRVKKIEKASWNSNNRSLICNFWKA